MLPESGGESGKGEGGQEGRVVDGDGELEGKKSKWIKTGIEFYEGKALVSTVVRDRWADWSLYPAALQVLGEGGEEGVELLIERCEFASFLLCLCCCLLFLWRFYPLPSQMEIRDGNLQEGAIISRKDRANSIAPRRE